jgi:hypothetical protein
MLGADMGEPRWSANSRRLAVGAAERCDLLNLILLSTAKDRSVPQLLQGSQLRRINPVIARNAGTPSPTQLNASQIPSPSNAANSPAALSRAITIGVLKTFQKLD